MTMLPTNWDPYQAQALMAANPNITQTELQYLMKAPAVAAAPVSVANGAVPTSLMDGYAAPGAILGPEAGGDIIGSEAWMGPLLMAGLGWLFGALFGGENGNGNGDPGTALVPSNGGAPGQYGGLPAKGQGNWEAFAEFGGLGKEGGEGWISAGRTTDGTGAISAETFRAWDPIQQKYYQLSGNNPYSNITLMPGRCLPGIGGFITKTWVTHAWRKDGSLASTQMAMTSNGRMVSLSETGVMKQWKPYKSIVIGKSLTTRNLRRVSTRVKSHAKSLKKILSILK